MLSSDTCSCFIPICTFIRSNWFLVLFWSYEGECTFGDLLHNFHARPQLYKLFLRPLVGTVKLM